MNPHRPIRDEVRHVAGDLYLAIVLEQVGLVRGIGTVGVLVVVDVSALESEEVLEPVCARTELRLPSEMPFADEPRGVSPVLEELRQGTSRGLETAYEVRRPGAERRLELEALLVAACDEARAGRGAGRAVRVEVGETHSLADEPVDVRRAEVGAAVAREVAVAHVVGHDEDDVGPARRLLRVREGGQRGERTAEQAGECRAHARLRVWETTMCCAPGAAGRWSGDSIFGHADLRRGNGTTRVAHRATGRPRRDRDCLRLCGLLLVEHLPPDQSDTTDRGGRLVPRAGSGLQGRLRRHHVGRGPEPHSPGARAGRAE